jgi:propanediol dehydratase small subunit
LDALTYPLAAHRDAVYTASGRPIAELTLERVLAGELAPDDVRVGPETLRLQAEFAERGGNPQLADNLRRGAELTAFADDELLRFYELLRPGRATGAEMDEAGPTAVRRSSARRVPRMSGGALRSEDAGSRHPHRHG